MKKFALIGAAGYIAPRHMAAIKDCGGELVAAIDPHDSVGILDSFSPECNFFVETERFWRFVKKNKVDYVVVCSPNYLHDIHCITAMRFGCDVICEKPIALTERNVDAILAAEMDTGRNVNVILQLRLHPDIEAFDPLPGQEVSFYYATPRGKWYHHSWKGNVEKSGGLATNIGVHLFDIVSFLYGKMNGCLVNYAMNDTVSGELKLDHANVEWTLSIAHGLTPHRAFVVNGVKIDLTNGFSDLHAKSYRMILDGKGFGVESARESVRICEKIRGSIPLYT